MTGKPNEHYTVDDFEVYPDIYHYVQQQFPGIFTPALLKIDRKNMRVVRLEPSAV